MKIKAPWGEIDCGALKRALGIKPRVEEINSIIATNINIYRRPCGRYYYKSGNCLIGIDNSTGQAIFESFKTKKACIEWLRKAVDIQ